MSLKMMIEENQNEKNLSYESLKKEIDELKFNQMLTFDPELISSVACPTIHQLMIVAEKNASFLKSFEIVDEKVQKKILDACHSNILFMKTISMKNLRDYIETNKEKLKNEVVYENYSSIENWEKSEQGEILSLIYNFIVNQQGFLLILRRLLEINENVILFHIRNSSKIKFDILSNDHLTNHVTILRKKPQLIWVYEKEKYFELLTVDKKHALQNEALNAFIKRISIDRNELITFIDAFEDSFVIERYLTNNQSGHYSYICNFCKKFVQGEHCCHNYHAWLSICICKIKNPSIEFQNYILNNHPKYFGKLNNPSGECVKKYIELLEGNMLIKNTECNGCVIL